MGYGRGRGRGGRAGRGSAGAIGPVDHEICEMERLANKFCACIYGTARLERERRLGIDDVVDDGHSDPLDRQRIVLRMYDGDIDTESSEAVWRRVREILEALCVLSVLSSTRSYSWRHNRGFWHRVFESDSRSSQRERLCMNPLLAPRDDGLVPSFVLDFSFLELSVDLVTLVRHALMGNVKSMRVSFLRAMESLATIHRRASILPTVRLALRFCRCSLTAPDIVDRITGLIHDLHDEFRDPAYGTSKTTIKTFRFQVNELDFGGVLLSARDFLSLRKLRASPQTPRLRVILDRSVDTVGNHFAEFAEVIRTWFEPKSPFLEAAEPDPERALRDEGTPLNVSDLSLDWSSLNRFHLAALFSAVHYSDSNSIKTLSLRGAFQFCDSRVAWAWLAFGIWSQNTQPHLRAIDLSCNSLNQEDVAVITRVREHSGIQYAWELMSKCPSSVRRRKGRQKNKAVGSTQPVQEVKKPVCELPWVLLKQGCQLRFQKTETWKNYPAFCLAFDTFGQLIHKQSDACAILLPGYGVMWADVVATKEQVSVVSSLAVVNGGIQELRMNALQIPEHENPSSVMEQLFKSLTLQCLTRLDLNGNRLSSEVLQAVLEACPVLETLNLEECELLTIAPLIHAYENSSCHVHTLNLARNRIGSRDISALCRLMVRSESSASSVRVLNLYANPIGRVGLHLLSLAIRECPSLTWLVLDRTQDPESLYRTAFAPFEYQSLGVQPLSPPHQLAFQQVLLSKLHCHTLDTCIVQRIHEYAASRVRRRVLWV